MSDLDLERLDSDGAMREAIDRIGGDTRAQFLGKALAGGGAAALAAPAAAAVASSSKIGKRDTAILNYALVLEYLQSAFYTEAERRGALKGEKLRLARVVGAVERAHVKAVRGALGRKAVKRPTFNFHGTTEDPDAFVRTAVAFEDLAVAAYKGQAYRIQSPAVLAVALSIHSVEARHAAWIRYLAGVQPAADAFDEPKPLSEVRRLVGSTHFIVASANTDATGRPRFTG